MAPPMDKHLTGVSPAGSRLRLKTRQPPYRKHAELRGSHVGLSVSDSAHKKDKTSSCSAGQELSVSECNPANTIQIRQREVRD